MLQKLTSYLFPKPHNLSVFDYRNNEVINQYAIEYNTSFEYAEKCFVELMKMFSISVENKANCVPSKEVDAIWHIFITYTKDYREFCYKYFDTFIDHIPNTNTDFDLKTDFIRTIQLLYKQFGEISPIWGLDNITINNIINPSPNSQVIILKVGDRDSCVSTPFPENSGRGKSCWGCFVILPIIGTGLMCLLLFIRHLW